MSPPLTPDAEEARRQLQVELSRPEYLDPGNWLADQLGRFGDWVSQVPQGSALSDANFIGIVIAVVLGALVAIWLVMGPLRSGRRRRSAVVLEENDRTARELRDEAGRLAASDQWGTATLHLFRAIVRSLTERAILDETPGMTAHEAAVIAGVRFPGLASRLAAAANIFDALAYGEYPGLAEQFAQLQSLDADVAQASPTRIDPPVEVRS